jgi:hypothetical protein
MPVTGTEPTQISLNKDVLCRMLAPFGPRAMSDLSPLSGSKRKTLARSEYFAF